MLKTLKCVIHVDYVFRRPSERSCLPPISTYRRGAIFAKAFLDIPAKNRQKLNIAAKAGNSPDLNI